MASSRFNLPWPLILYVAGVMFLDWWLNEYSWWLSTRMKLHPCLSVGNVFGQIGMVVMVGGLWGRTWLAGWLFASSLVIAAFSTLFFASFSPFGTEQWGVLFIMPLIVLGGCLPLMVLRYWRGWSLTRSDQLELPKTNSRVEDLFIFSIAVACAIALTKVSFVPTGPMPGAELIALAYGAGYSS